MNLVSQTKCVAHHKTRYTVFVITMKGCFMTSAQDVPVPSQLAISRPRKQSDTNVFLTILTVLIGIAAIAGIIVTVTMGLTNVALAIGIVGCAFFARAFC
jgi:hypothetical protein